MKLLEKKVAEVPVVAWIILIATAFAAVNMVFGRPWF